VKLCTNNYENLSILKVMAKKSVAPFYVDRVLTFTIAFRIGSECPFIERLVLVETFS